MIDLNVSLVVQLVNFLVTIVVLNWLLIRPVREIIKQRKDAVAGMVSEVETFSGDATAKLEKYEEALAQARRNATAERESVKDAAVEEEHRLVGAATEEAQADLKSAREEIEAQVKAAMDGLKGQVDSLAQKAADRVLG